MPRPKTGQTHAISPAVTLSGEVRKPKLPTGRMSSIMALEPETVVARGRQARSRS